MRSPFKSAGPPDPHPRRRKPPKVGVVERERRRWAAMTEDERAAERKRIGERAMAKRRRFAL